MKILIVDDHEVMISGITTLLDDYETRGCANLNQALPMILEWDPDIIICDLDFGEVGNGGFDLAEQAWEADCLSKFIMYTGADINKAILLGDIKGLIGKNIFAIESKVRPTVELQETVRKVADGRRPFDGYTVRVAKSNLPNEDLLLIERFFSLTERQLELVGAYAVQPDRKSVAKELHIADSTVKNYTSSILEVFNVENMRTVVSQYQKFQEILRTIGYQT